MFKFIKKEIAVLNQIAISITHIDSIILDFLHRKQYDMFNMRIPLGSSGDEYISLNNNFNKFVHKNNKYTFYLNTDYLNEVILFENNNQLNKFKEMMIHVVNETIRANNISIFHNTKFIKDGVEYIIVGLAIGKEIFDCVESSKYEEPIKDIKQFTRKEIKENLYSKFKGNLKYHCNGEEYELVSEKNLKEV